jgi:hypothetical protein
MLRGYLEKIMGLCTGSDGDITLGLIDALMQQGLPGEGLVDKRVWVIKTHYPERMGRVRYGCERALLLVRSPLDAIVSLFNMDLCNSHDTSIADEDFVKFAKVWTKYVNQEIELW